jgi:hypothetical protein
MAILLDNTESTARTQVAPGRSAASPARYDAIAQFNNLMKRNSLLALNQLGVLRDVVIFIDLWTFPYRQSGYLLPSISMGYIAEAARGVSSCRLHRTGRIG